MNVGTGLEVVREYGTFHSVHRGQGARSFEDVHRANVSEWFHLVVSQ